MEQEFPLFCIKIASDSPSTQKPTWFTLASGSDGFRRSYESLTSCARACRTSTCAVLVGPAIGVVPTGL